MELGTWNLLLQPCLLGGTKELSLGLPTLTHNHSVRDGFKCNLGAYTFIDLSKKCDHVHVQLGTEFSITKAYQFHNQKIQQQNDSYT